MLYNDLIFNLSIKEDLRYPDMRVVQGDTKSHRFIVSLKDTVDKKRVAKDLTNANLVTFTFLKEDGNSVVGQGEFVDKVNGIVQYVCGTQETTYPGKVKATIEVYAEGGVRLTSAIFDFKVVAQLNNGTGVTSTTEYTALQQALVDVNSVNFQESSRQTNEISRIDNENTRQTNETARIQRMQELEGVNAVQLHERQNSFDEQLAQTATKQELQNIGNASPKGTYATLTALQTAFPNGTNGIYVIAADGKWYFWNGSVWTAGGQYQSSGVANQSVTSVKLLLNNNLLPKSYPFVLGALNTTTGAETNDAWNRRVRSDFIRVYKGDIAEIIDKATTHFAVARYDLNKNFIGYNAWRTDNWVFDGDYFVRFMQRKQNDEANLSDFDFFSNNLFIHNTKTAPSKIDMEERLATKIDRAILVRSSKNLFDGNFVNARLNGVSPFNYIVGTGGRSTIVEVEPNTTYTVSQSDDTDMLRVGTFTNYPIENAIPNQSIREYWRRKLTIKTGVNDRYMVVVVSTATTNATPHLLQIEKGDTVTAHEEPYILKDGIVKSKEHEYLIADNLDGYYKSITTNITLDNTLTSSSLYELYDALVSQYPDYITRTLLGTQPTGLPIYRYDFIPASSRNLPEKPPKVMYISGMHPEKAATTGGIRFFTDLCKNWAFDETLQSLRWNVHFVVIPCLNPYGYNANTRGNYNGVNLNRNFAYDWVYNPNATDYDKTGTHAMSEMESQLVDYILKNENIMFLIDNHSWTTLAEQSGQVVWMGTMLYTKLTNLISSIGRRLNSNVKKDYPYLGSGNNSLVSINPSNTNQGWLYLYANSIGIPTIILEVCGNYENPSTGITDALKYIPEVIGNIVAGVVKNINNNRNVWLKQ